LHPDYTPVGGLAIGSIGGRMANENRRGIEEEWAPEMKYIVCIVHFPLNQIQE
jgi:hypothetical protein